MTDLLGMFTATSEETRRFDSEIADLLLVAVNHGDAVLELKRWIKCFGGKFEI